MTTRTRWWWLCNVPVPRCPRSELLLAFHPPLYSYSTGHHSNVQQHQPHIWCKQCKNTNSDDTLQFSATSFSSVPVNWCHQSVYHIISVVSVSYFPVLDAKQFQLQLQQFQWLNSLVVGAFLWRARRLGICCQTVFVTQNWVSILSNVSWRHTFLRNINDKVY